jgi:hypothetical protein
MSIRYDKLETMETLPQARHWFDHYSEALAQKPLPLKQVTEC